MQYGNNGQRDFHHNGGGNAQPYAECAACQRHLPTALLALDHIVSRATYVQRIMRQGPITIWNGQLRDVTHDYECGTAMGHAVTITKLASMTGHKRPRGVHRRMPIPATMRTIDVQTLTLCDLHNLQWLCVGCNSSKGNAFWANWIGTTPYGGRQPQPMK